MPGKLPFEKAKEKFDLQGRTDIVLCKEGYTGWGQKSKFYDYVVQDYFWSIPRNVLKLETVHPKRRNDKRKQLCFQRYGVSSTTKLEATKSKMRQTNLKRYGVENTTQSSKVKEKIKATNLERYGTTTPLKSELVKVKIKQSNLKKYGHENVSSSEAIKNKKKQKAIERYGVENISQAKEVREKVKQTNLERYGYEYISQVPEVKSKKVATFLEKYGVTCATKHPNVINKMKQTNLKRYGHINTFQTKEARFLLKKALTKYYTADTNIPVIAWFEQQPEPKPTLGWLYKCVENYKYKVSEANLNEALKGFRNNKTSLEVFTEQLFNIHHFNKKPSSIQKFYKPDFKLNETTYLNVDGLYWHSEKVLDKWYHFEMRKHFEEHGLRLFQIREDELYLKSDIVKSIVNHALGVSSSKIYARNCYVSTVPHPEAATFLIDNHLMGLTKAKHIGLYDRSSNQLVSILSYKQKQNVCKIERFCSILDTSVVGGFSKLLKHLEQNCLNPEIAEIHNWVDLRYGTGAHLAHKGFRIVHETLGWKWTDGYLTFNRLRCRANMDERKLSMQEHADELEWVKLYDGGQRLWVKKL